MRFLANLAGNLAGILAGILFGTKVTALIAFVAIGIPCTSFAENIFDLRPNAYQLTNEDGSPTDKASLEDRPEKPRTFYLSAPSMQLANRSFRLQMKVDPSVNIVEDRTAWIVELALLSGNQQINKIRLNYVFFNQPGHSQEQLLNQNSNRNALLLFTQKSLQKLADSSHSPVLPNSLLLSDVFDSFAYLVTISMHLML